MNQKISIGISVVCIAILITLALHTLIFNKPVSPHPSSSQTVASSTDTQTASSLTTYHNEKYGFEIQYPDTWQVVVTEDDIAPKINIYKKIEQQEPPFTHQSNVTQVSLFPEGIPTEGVQGETATSTMKFIEPIKKAQDYVLQDGIRWATFASFQKIPASWEPYGFLWASTYVENQQVECRGQELVINQGSCDIGTEYENTHTARGGTISSQDRETEAQIIASFKFVK